MDELRRELLGIAAQIVIFTLGLCLSLGAGILLGSRTDGPGELLAVTLIAGMGLLGAAVLSQIIRDRIVYGHA